MADFDFTKLTAFDVETIGDLDEYALQPWRIVSHQARIRTYAVAQLRNGKIVSAGFHGDPITDCTEYHLDRVEVSEQLTRIADQGQTMVTWNGAFDIACLIAAGFQAEVERLNWFDAMLLWKRVSPRLNEYGLKKAVSVFFPQYAGYGEDVDFKGLLAPLLKYNKLDSTLTLALAIKFIKQLTQREFNGFKIECHDLPMVADATVRGIPLNPPALVPLYAELKAKHDDAMAKLAGKIPEGLNVRSPKQMPILLYDTWGLPILAHTDTGNPSTDKATLKELALDYPDAKSILDVREALNQVGKYVKGPLNSIQYLKDSYRDAVVVTHPIQKKASTYTGRSTYSSKQKNCARETLSKRGKVGSKKVEVPIGIALHQWMRGKAARDVIQAPPGYLIVEHDFSGQEMRWMAEESEDAAMCNIFLSPPPYDDAHSYMASRLSAFSFDQILKILDEENGTEEFSAAKKARYLGKFANLSMQYRTGVKTLRIKALADYDLVLTKYETEALKNTYLTTFPGVKQYWEKQIWLAKRQGYVETKAGRRVYFDDNSWTQDNEWSSGSTAINFPIQGVGAEQKALATAVMRPYLVRHGGLYGWELHDGVYTFWPESIAELHARKLKTMLSNLPYKKAWGYQPKLPFPVDAKIGRTWGELKTLSD